MQDTDKQGQVIKYNDVISNPREFSETKFREVLETHGIHVVNLDGNRRQIKLEAHGGVPDIYIDVPVSGLKFDKYVFSEFSGEGKHQHTLERRLQYLNAILLRSGYVGEKITPEMLDSEKKIYLSLGEVAQHEYEHFQRNQVSGQHPDVMYFNHPDGKELRIEEMKRRMDENFTEMQRGTTKCNEEKMNHIPIKEEARTIINKKTDSDLKITAVVGGRTLNFNLSVQMQQKLMAIDDSHRLKLLEHILPDKDLRNMATTEKEGFMRQVDEQLFGKASVFTSQFSHTSTIEQKQPEHAPSAQTMASANYDCIMQAEDGNAQTNKIQR